MDLPTLYMSRAGALKRRLTRMLGSPADAEDVVQDAFMRIYVAELGDRTELSAALLTVTARRLALNTIRNRVRRGTDAVGDMDTLGVLSSDRASDGVEAAEIEASLGSAMAAMPPQCRQVFRMRKIDGSSHAEIAAALGIASKTVERHLTKALKICRDQFAQDGYIACASRTRSA
jgi:RNA polymerase sigma factor (sigma-70 family)